MCNSFKLYKSFFLKIILCLFALILFVGHTSVVAASNKSSPKFILTEDEQKYLETLRLRPIVIAYSYDLVMAEFDGEHLGMLDPILNILINEFGLDVTLLKADWQNAFIKVENKEVDFYGPLAIPKSRSQRYITVDPFYRSYSKIMTRIGEPINSMLGLNGRSIGLLTGSVISRTLKTYLGPSSQIVYFPTMDGMINGLESGVIDAFATVDNAEFEIMTHDKIQFEFTIDNYYADQGLISGNEDMRTLAVLLNRYLLQNPQVLDEIDSLRHQALLKNSQKRFADEIEYLQSNYNEITMFADTTLYPLCYLENGVVKGMQLEINGVFEELAGINIRFASDREFPNGMSSALELLKSGECQAFVGGYFDIDTWNDPAFLYSSLLWTETLHTYSYKDAGSGLFGKTIGTTLFKSDYLGWNNLTGNPPILYNSRKELIDALKSGEVDEVFMGEMKFNYGYTVLKDYSLKEIDYISAEAPMYILYGAQNKEFNTLFNEAMVLFQVLKPQSPSIWKSQSNKYKADYIRMRYIQQTWVTVVIAIFIVMLVLLFILLKRNRNAYKNKAAILEVVQEKNQIITSSINYASKIQKNLLPKEDKQLKNVFSDYSVIWKPKDLVGGDIYWVKSFDEGTILCVCDCTGHGTPGALLTMLVVSAFEAIVGKSNYKDTANVIWELDQRLVTVLNAHTTDSMVKDGCDLAVLYIAKDGGVIVSGANTHVFVCDGKEVTQIKGQRLYIGEGKLKNKDEVFAVAIPPNPDNKFYVASDGLYDQIGSESRLPFGYKTFKRIILENHNENQAAISEKIWEAFEKHRGGEIRRDDFELITFKP